MTLVPQDFLDISNPKAVLEMTLRGFSCLTRGDCICLHYNNKKYYIDIIEAKPQVNIYSVSLFWVVREDAPLPREAHRLSQLTGVIGPSAA